MPAQYNQGLDMLLNALRGGLPASQGYDLLSNMVSQQQAKTQARQSRLQGLSDLITGAGSQGMDYGAASALLQAQPGNVPAQAMQMLNQTYPTVNQPATNTPEFRPGMANYTQQAAPPAHPMQELSPLAPQPDPMQMMQLQQQQFQTQELAQQQAMEPVWEEFAIRAMQYRDAGDDLQTFMQKAGPFYGALISADSERVQNILSTIFVGTGTAGA